jgi:hypothetical protein
MPLTKLESSRKKNFFLQNSNNCIVIFQKNPVHI